MINVLECHYSSLIGVRIFKFNIIEFKNSVFFFSIQMTNYYIINYLCIYFSPEFLSNLSNWFSPLTLTPDTYLAGRVKSITCFPLGIFSNCYIKGQYNTKIKVLTTCMGSQTPRIGLCHCEWYGIVYNFIPHDQFYVLRLRLRMAVALLVFIHTISE